MTDQKGGIEFCTQGTQRGAERRAKIWKCNKTLSYGKALCFHSYYVPFHVMLEIQKPFIIEEENVIISQVTINLNISGPNIARAKKQRCFCNISRFLLKMLIVRYISTLIWK